MRARQALPRHPKLAPIRQVPPVPGGLQCSARARLGMGPSVCPLPRTPPAAASNPGARLLRRGRRCSRSRGRRAVWFVAAQNVACRGNPAAGVLYCGLGESRTIVGEHCDGMGTYFLGRPYSRNSGRPRLRTRLAYAARRWVSCVDGVVAGVPWWRGVKVDVTPPGGTPSWLSVHCAHY